MRRREKALSPPQVDSPTREEAESRLTRMMTRSSEKRPPINLTINRAPSLSVDSSPPRIGESENSYKDESDDQSINSKISTKSLTPGKRRNPQPSIENELEQDD